MEWTVEKHARLVSMAPHQTATEIGDALGCSRNAVLGRANRNGISLASEHKAARVFAYRGGGRPKGTKLPDDHPSRRSRPKGSHAFSLRQRAAVLAAQMAGASWARAASIVGASKQSAYQNWRHDPQVVAAARAILDEAHKDALQKKANRKRLLLLASAAVAEHNNRVLAGWGERNRTFVLRKLAGESLSSIAADYGLTRERVRQILMRAIDQGLRSPPGVNLLRDRATS